MTIDQPSAGTAGSALAAGRKHAAEVWRVTAVGLVVNILLSILKVTGGVLGRSRAMVADGIHSVSDLATDLAVLIGVHFWSRPADQDHPYGHRRIETLVTTGIGVSLAVVGAGILYDGIATMQEQHGRLRPGALALAAGIVSIIAKEILYQWTVRVGRRVKSTAVVANAWHHRSDSFSSVVAVAAVGGSMLCPTWCRLDHIGAVIVGIFILHAAWQLSWPALKELVDEGVPRRDQEWIRKTALEVSGVEHVHAIRTRYVGSRVQVDLHVLVEGEMSVRAGHEISERVKERLLADGPDLADVVVHLEPREEK